MGHIFPGEEEILYTEIDINNEPQLDRVNQRVHHNLRSLRHDSSVFDTVEIQSLVDDLDQPDAGQGEEVNVVGRKRKSTNNNNNDNNNDNKYKSLNKRIKWEVVSQTEQSLRTIPIYGGRIPFINEVKEPIDYFRMFFDHELLQYICNESNRYALQTDISNRLCLEPKELEVFIGISFYMSLVKLPRTRYYWK